MFKCEKVGENGERRWSGVKIIVISILFWSKMHVKFFLGLSQWAVAGKVL